MKFLKPTMIAFSVLILLLFCFGLAQLCKWQWPTEFGAADWVMSVALGIFCVLIFLGMFGHKFDVKRLGSYFLHFGLVLFLLGCMLYSATGVSVTAAVPVNSSVAYSTIQKSDGELLELGFKFGLDNFKIEYYDPVYDVYRMTDDGAKSVKTDIQMDSDGFFDFGKYGGKYHVNKLVDFKGDIQEEINLGNNYVAVVRKAVKKYTASMTFIDDKGQTHKDLLVNYPVRKGGYKIYLMSYNESAKSATLLFKKDIGEPFSTAGLIFVMGGTLFHCLGYPAIKKLGGKKLPLKEGGTEK